MLVTVTFALAIAAPEGSVTTPVNCPFWTCATAIRAKLRMHSEIRHSCTFFMRFLPSEILQLRTVGTIVPQLLDITDNDEPKSHVIVRRTHFALSSRSLSRNV